MPSSSAAVSPSPSQPLPSGGDGGRDEIEYESEPEEIEEEFEVEEEVEVHEPEEQENEEGGEESEIGEDLTPARKEDNLDDTVQDMELEEDEEHLNSDPLIMRMSVANPQVDIATNPTFCGASLSSEFREGRQREELYANERTSFRDTDAKVSTDINNKTFWSECNAPLTMTDACGQKDSGVGSAVAKPLQTAAEAIKIKEEMPSRMSGPMLTPRDHDAENFDVANKRPKLVCQFHAQGWCIRGKSCKFLHIKEGLDAAGQKTVTACSGVHMLPPQSRDILANCQIGTSAIHERFTLDGALAQAGNMPVGQNSRSDDFRALHGNFSGVLCDTYNKSRFFSSGTDENVSKKNELVPDAHRLNSPFYPRPTLPFGSSSWTANALGTWNTLECNQEHRAPLSSSFRNCPSPLSGSNSGSNNLPNMQPTMCNTKICPDGWEPSVPFRPSHVITKNLFLKESPHDPILDSVEQTGAKDWPFEFSYPEPGVSANNAHFQSNKLQKEKVLDANHVEDTRKAIRLSSSCDNGLKLDDPRHQKELQMDGCGKKNENGIDIKRDENVPNESKALKYFQAALVEYVKELVKPTWREGLMSKDAHKIIVKKAVEKVLSTVQPDQVPNSAESIKSYLSISQIKLSKLVEAYIEKYGKS